jgi:hypothetical protein
MMKRLCALALSFLFVSCLVPATDVGVGDGGKTAGRATRQLRKSGTDFSRGGAQCRGVGLEERRVAVSLSQLAQGYDGQLNRLRHPV